MIPRPPELARFSRLCFVVGGGLAVLGLSPLADGWVLAFGVLVASVGALPHLVAAEERHHALLLELEPDLQPELELEVEPAEIAPAELTVDQLLARLRPVPELEPPADRGPDRWVLTDFRLPVTVGAARVTVVGEFNDWSHTATPMHVEGDCFVARVPLEAGRRYRFRYLLDGERWENDWSADAYLPNAFGDDDSVVEVRAATTASTTTIPSPCGGASVPEPVLMITEVAR
ncbi:MAG: hypothetical protein M3Z03_12735 [Actinomycetota bacterium]|nr:hypothetical protein [Actinomycetota bacterium]